MKTLVTSIVIAIIAVLCYTNNSSSVFLYSSNDSPTGNYTIKIFGENKILNSLPFKKGSNSGYVILIDNKTGKQLKSKTMTEIRQDFTIIKWEQDKVELDQFVEWKLPRADAGRISEHPKL